MAKLNGVKTLDMVNGEITKVAYDGAQYAVVEGGEVTSTSDILQAKYTYADRTEGDFYRVLKVGASVSWEENDGRKNGISAKYIDERFKVFRKISATSPTIEERVTALESDVAALKGEGKSQAKRDISQVKVGDKVRVVDAKVVAALEAENGSVLEVTRSADSDGDFYVMDTDGEVLVVFKTEAHAFEIVEADDVITFEGEQKAAKPYEPKVGDIVVVTANTNHSANKIGDIGVVAPSQHTNRIVVNVPGRENTGDGWTTTKPEEVRPATAEEIAQYEKAVEVANKPKPTAQALKAGDFVKITDDNATDFCFTDGKIYEVFIDSDGDLYVIDDDNDEDYCSITDGDVKYEILSADEAKWVKLNRKVGEYKKGDIVRVLEDFPCGSSRKQGYIGEIVHYDDNDSFVVGHEVSGWMGAEYVELVAPVESVLK